MPYKWFVTLALITCIGCVAPASRRIEVSDPTHAAGSNQSVAYSETDVDPIADPIALPAPVPPPEPAVGVHLPEVSIPELPMVPDWSEVSGLLDPKYQVVRPLDSEACYVQAMATTGLGHLIEIERDLQRCLKTTKQNAQAKCIVDRLLVYRAEQERNRAAGAALEAFYSVAEVEAQKKLLHRTSLQTERLAKAAAGVKDSGVNAQIDLLGIELQEIEVRRRTSELQKNESSLQFNLRRLIGDDPSDPTQIVPLVNLDVSSYPGARGTAVETAFECRAELKAQDFLLSFHDDAALDSTRQQLRTTDGSLGTTIPGCDLKLLAILFHGDDAQIELCYRVKQLRQLRYETMRLIEVEVSAAYFAVCNRLQRLSLAKAEAERRKEYVGRLEAARDTVHYRYQDLADARIRLLAAEADLIHELYALRIDEAKLTEAQGLYSE